MASYTYNGGGRMVTEDFEQPEVRLDLWGQTSGEYAGFDRFGRVALHHWRRYASGNEVDLDKLAYGHDCNSNRLWRENIVAASDGQRLDEQYIYDDLDRLTTRLTGELIGDKTIPTGTWLTGGEGWTLDAVGNWDQYDRFGTGGAELVQTRTTNDANEITDIGEYTGPSWTTPTYDAAGNMTSIPRPTAPTDSFACVYDAWNRLVKVTDGGDPAKTVATYEYDGLGRRIVAGIDTSSPAAPDGTLDTYRHDLYAGWQRVETRRTTVPQPTRRPSPPPVNTSGRRGTSTPPSAAMRTSPGPVRPAPVSTTTGTGGCT